MESRYKKRKLIKTEKRQIISLAGAGQVLRAHMEDLVPYMKPAYRCRRCTSPFLDTVLYVLKELCLATTTQIGIVYRSSAVLIQRRCTSITPGHCICKKKPKQQKKICKASNSWKALPSLQKPIWSLADVFDSNVTTANFRPGWIYVMSDYKVSSYYVETCLTVKLLFHWTMETWGASWPKRPLTTTHIFSLSGQ